MKKKSTKKSASVDIERLKFWKKASTKAKLDWLDQAYKFGKLRKFN